MKSIVLHDEASNEDDVIGCIPVGIILIAGVSNLVQRGDGLGRKDVLFRG